MASLVSCYYGSSLLLREGGFQMGIILMPCLEWQSQAAITPFPPPQGLPFPKACFGVVQGDLFGGDLLPQPRELHMSSTCWFPVEEGLGAFLSLGLGNWSHPGSRDWVSALGFRCIKLFLLWHLIANEKAQVTLRVFWAVVDHSDNIWHPEAPYFHLKHVALGRQVGWHLMLTHEVLACQHAHLLTLPEFRW